MKLLNDILERDVDVKPVTMIGLLEDEIESCESKFAAGLRVVRPQDERRKALRADFQKLADQWHRDTDGYSAIQKKVSHPAYLRILVMGKDALPLILEELSIRPGHWFVALSNLIEDEENPVPPEHAGDMQLVINDWLEFGRRKKLLT